MIDHSFEHGCSPIHRLDPGVRILAATFLSIAAALSEHLGIISCYLGLSLMLCALAGLSPNQMAGRLRPLFWFVLMIWIFLPLTFTRDVIAHYGWITISRYGIEVCTRITLKSFAILLIFSALILTMPVASLGAALHRLKVPDKMVFLLLMTYRYISVIRDEYHRLHRAARFRGFRPGTNIHSYKTYAYLAGMLFVRASHRATRVYQAMLCRGFSQKFHTLDVYAPYGLNSVFFCTMAAAATALTLIERFFA